MIRRWVMAIDEGTGELTERIGRHQWSAAVVQWRPTSDAKRSEALPSKEDVRAVAVSDPAMALDMRVERIMTLDANRSSFLVTGDLSGITGNFMQAIKSMPCRLHV